MGNNYSSTQIQALNNLSPIVKSTGINLGDELDAIRTALSSGNLGITADAADVDALAKDGGHFTRDLDAADGSTLDFAWKTSYFHNGLTLVTVAGGSITLSASATNYVEVDRAGVVSANTSGFTSGSLPLWIVTTGVSSIGTVVNRRGLLQLIGLAGVVGAMLSTMAKTKSITLNLGDVGATTVFRFTLPAHVARFARVSFVCGTAVATDNTNYWTFGLVNKGAANAGTTAVVDGTAAANSTKTTGGSAIAVNVKRALTLSGTSADLDTASEDVCELTITKNGTATAMAGCSIRFDLTFEG